MGKITFPNTVDNSYNILVKNTKNGKQKKVNWVVIELQI